MFNEIIWIIALSYDNASCSFIQCMDKNINSINEKNNIYFYPKYMSRNDGIVTSEYEPDLSFVISHLGKTWCFKVRVIFWMTRIKIHFVSLYQWLSPSCEAPCEPLQVRNSPWYLYLIFCLICSGGSNRAGDDGGKGSAVCKGRRAGTSVSLRHHAVPACHSRRESLSPLLREITRCQISVKSKSLLFEDKEFIRIFNSKILPVQKLLWRGVPGCRGAEEKKNGSNKVLLKKE